MLTEQVDENTIAVTKIYDTEIINYVASSFIYAMSGFSHATLLEHREIANQYMKEPTKLLYDRMMEGYKNLKNPVMECNLRDAAHCLYIVLLNAFQASTAGVEEMRAKNGEVRISDHEKETAFKAWVVHLVNEVYAISQGRMEAVEVPKEGVNENH